MINRTMVREKMPDFRDSKALRDLAEALSAVLSDSLVHSRQTLARYTSLRVGGQADLVAVVENRDSLRKAVTLAWEHAVPCRVLGGGSNVLVGDLGVRGLVVINRARSIEFGESLVLSESGAILSVLARQSVARGMAGLEWAIGIPGTVGGAVVGNAGAWGGNIASVLEKVSILEPTGDVVTWPAERLEYGYRKSVLKRGAAPGQRSPIVLDAQFVVEAGEPEELKARMLEITTRRKASQPTGATCGSVFKNPEGDYAGRLIDAAGLKGYRHGGAHISTQHANFIINDSDAAAADVRALIDTVMREVDAKFGIRLELEIELLGAWQDYPRRSEGRRPASVESPGARAAGPTAVKQNAANSPGREQMSNRLRVGLLFGGRSGEHEVSLMSAQGIMDAIDASKYEVVPIGISKGGQWLASGDPMKALSSGVQSESQPAALLAEPGPQALMQLEASGQGRAITATKLGRLDVIFPILHGPFGEDGTVQGLLELAGVPYVGAGVTASAVGMDKGVFKDIMLAHGLASVPHVVVKRRDWERNPDETIARIESEIGFECFVKPANLGSSVGISKAHGRAELCEALDEAARYDRRIVVEEALDAREIEVSVLGNDDPIASVPGEVVPCNEFYDYSAKYLDGDSELIIPAQLDHDTAELIRRMAVEAYSAIDCAGMARADFLLDRRTGKVYVNELNTLPGFTPISMYPKLWEASGISYTDLIDRLIQLGLERHADKSRSATTYKTRDGD
jgi:D-alanine-D-alanine ligase